MRGRSLQVGEVAGAGRRVPTVGFRTSAGGS